MWTLDTQLYWLEEDLGLTNAMKGAWGRGGGIGEGGGKEGKEGEVREREG